MTVFINMKGAIEPVEIAGNFDVTMGILELAHQRGLSFMITQTAERAPLALQISEILTVSQGNDPYDDDDDDE